MRLILTTIILTMLAQPVWAKSVYHCVTTKYAGISPSSIMEFESERFMMSVDSNKAEMRGEGYLGVILDVISIDEGGIVSMKYDYSSNGPFLTGSFNPPHLFYTALGSLGITSVHATCEKF